MVHWQSLITNPYNNLYWDSDNLHKTLLAMYFTLAWKTNKWGTIFLFVICKTIHFWRNYFKLTCKYEVNVVWFVKIYFLIEIHIQRENIELIAIFSQYNQNLSWIPPLFSYVTYQKEWANYDVLLIRFIFLWN
jgi:hypothetical protein